MNVKRGAAKKSRKRGAPKANERTVLGFSTGGVPAPSRQA